MVVEQLAADLKAGSWRSEHQAAVSRAEIEWKPAASDDLPNGANGQPVMLAKPQTFMNLSGQAVRGLMARYTILPADLLVISDDLDLPFGRLRLRLGGSPGGHNGLKSIIAEIGTTEFLRLRMGIGRPQSGEPIEWVLSPFDEAERRDLDYIRTVAAEAALYIVRHGIRAAMNVYNGRADVRGPKVDESSVGAGGPPPLGSAPFRRLAPATTETMRDLGDSLEKSGPAALPSGPKLPSPRATASRPEAPLPSPEGDHA
jgi:PTH1 family peptidyl-tRNA hydrolase